MEETRDVSITLKVKGEDVTVILNGVQSRVLESRESGLLVVIGACAESPEHVIILAHIPRHNINDFIQATIEACSRSDWPTERGN